MKVANIYFVGNFKIKKSTSTVEIGIDQFCNLYQIKENNEVERVLYYKQERILNCLEESFKITKLLNKCFFKSLNSEKLNSYLESKLGSLTSTIIYN